MLQYDDNVNMMLSWYMKCNHTLNTTFLRDTVVSQQIYLTLTSRVYDLSNLTKLILKPYWSHNMTQTRSNPNPNN